ncbi:MAG TPA: hypothetical protein VGL53_05605 [Bryobacteraceae bacterium]|jgi:hypothetical protein
MTASRFVLLLFLAASAAFAQFCDKIEQRDADSILGGAAMPMSLGSLGCSYSVRSKGVRLTLTMSDEGPGARKIYDGLKQKTRASGWLASDEPFMATTAAYGELIKSTPASPAGKCGFVVLKGSRLIQIYVSDSGGKTDLASRRETLDRLRPIAKRVVDQIH